MKLRFLIPGLALGLLFCLAWGGGLGDQQGPSQPDEASHKVTVSRGVVPGEKLTRGHLHPEVSEVGDPGFSESTQSRVLVVVSMVDQAPLEGAVAILDDGVSDSSLGYTDAHGELGLPAETHGWVTVRCPGFAPNELFLARSAPQELVVVELETGGLIRGQVQAGSLSPGFEEFHVVGWDSLRPPSRSDWRKWLAGEPSRILDADVDPNGTFELTGLDLGRSYRFLAGGPGFLAEGPSVLVKPGVEVLTLPVIPLFGCRITLQGNAQWATGGALPRYWLSSWVAEIGTPGRPVVSSDPKLLLGGIDEPFSGSADDVFLFYFGQTDGLEVPGPVEVEVAIPGMSRSRAVVELESTRSGLVEHALQLDAVHGDSGSVHFRFSTMHGEGLPVLEGTVSGINLKIWRDDGAVAEYVVLDTSSPFVIGGLPYGSYNYRIQAGKGLSPRASGRTFFEGHFPVGAATQSVEVPLLSVGGIEVEFPLPNGFQYRGPAVLVLSSLENNGGDWPRVFRRPPYRFGAIPQGMYAIEAVSNSSTGFVQKVFKSPAFQVSDGQVSVVEIPLDSNDPNPF